jgi:hypothetical protein
MVGGHQATAMPTEILTDPRFARCEVRARLTELSREQYQRRPLVVSA